MDIYEHNQVQKELAKMYAQGVVDGQRSMAKEPRKIPTMTSSDCNILSLNQFLQRRARLAK